MPKQFEKSLSLFVKFLSGVDEEFSVYSCKLICLNLQQVIESKPNAKTTPKLRHVYDQLNYAVIETPDVKYIANYIKSQNITSQINSICDGPVFNIKKLYVWYEFLSRKTNLDKQAEQLEKLGSTKFTHIIRYLKDIKTAEDKILAVRRVMHALEYFYLIKIAVELTKNDDVIVRL